MDYNTSFQISASGMAVEKLRLDVTALNLANMSTTAASVDQLYQPKRVLSGEATFNFSQQFDGQYSIQSGGARILSVEAITASPKTVYEPGHPYADSKGFVSYPGINQSSEMVNMMTALRAYEANVVAMNAAKTMAARALEIGGQ